MSCISRLMTASLNWSLLRKVDSRARPTRPDGTDLQAGNNNGQGRHNHHNLDTCEACSVHAGDRPRDRGEGDAGSDQALVAMCMGLT
jgi:ABC-type nickel/cobalt efflux system permease component RcnA